MANKTIWVDGDNITAAKLNNLENNAATGADNGTSALNTLNKILTPQPGSDLPYINGTRIFNRTIYAEALSGIPSLGTVGSTVQGKVQRGFVKTVEGTSKDQFTVQEKISKDDLDFDAADAQSVIPRKLNPVPFRDNHAIEGLRYFSIQNNVEGSGIICPGTVVRLFCGTTTINPKPYSIDLSYNVTDDPLNPSLSTIGTLVKTKAPDLKKQVYFGRVLYGPSEIIGAGFYFSIIEPTTPDGTFIVCAGIHESGSSNSAVANGSYDLQAGHSLAAMIWGPYEEYIRGDMLEQ